MNEIPKCELRPVVGEVIFPDGTWSDIKTRRMYALVAIVGAIVTPMLIELVLVN